MNILLLKGDNRQSSCQLAEKRDNSIKKEEEKPEDASQNHALTVAFILN